MTAYYDRVSASLLEGEKGLEAELVGYEAYRALCQLEVRAAEGSPLNGALGSQVRAMLAAELAQHPGYGELCAIRRALKALADPCVAVRDSGLSGETTAQEAGSDVPPAFVTDPRVSHTWEALPVDIDTAPAPLNDGVIEPVPGGPADIAAMLAAFAATDTVLAGGHAELDVTPLCEPPLDWSAVGEALPEHLGVIVDLEAVAAAELPEPAPSGLRFPLDGAASALVAQEVLQLTSLVRGAAQEVQLPLPVTSADDLTRIRGIDTLMAAQLEQLHVTRYGQIAAWTASDCEAAWECIGPAARIAEDNWIEQAAILASGRDTAHAGRQALGLRLTSPEPPLEPEGLEWPDDAAALLVPASLQHRISGTYQSSALRDGALAATAAAVAASVAAAEIVRSNGIASDSWKSRDSISRVPRPRLTSLYEEGAHANGRHEPAAFAAGIWAGTDMAEQPLIRIVKRGEEPEAVPEPDYVPATYEPLPTRPFGVQPGEAVIEFVKPQDTAALGVAAPPAFDPVESQAPAPILAGRVFRALTGGPS